jgi:peptidoglycan/xylan/chitin deacetylase (PgdA/CDA1 family)
VDPDEEGAGMKKKRALLAALMGMARLLEEDGSERTRRRPTLTVLAYHRVCPYDPATYLLDDDLVSATPEAFDAQMRWVKAEYDVISFAELAAAWPDRPLPARPLILTFDDGYRDNHDVALPILAHHGLPATVFVSTAYIGRRDLFWFDKLAYWLKRTRQRRLILRGAIGREFPIGEHRHPLIRTIQDLLKAADEQTHEDVMQQVERQLDVPLEGVDQGRPLTWDEARRMVSRNIELGSHTVRHLNLARLSPDRLEAELCRSKTAIEAEARCAVVAVAYPFGTPDAYSDTVRQAAAGAGYRFAVAYGGTVNDIRSMDPFAIQRVAVERDMSLDLFRAQLRYPRLLQHR